MKILFRRATGWFGWTPETAWSATPVEIADAFAGWMEKHEATTPRFTDEPGQPKPKTDKAKPYTAEQMQFIEDNNFDPAFDREGLHALKARLA